MLKQRQNRMLGAQLGGISGLQGGLQGHGFQDDLRFGGGSHYGGNGEHGSPDGRHGWGSSVRGGGGGIRSNEDLRMGLHSTGSGDAVLMRKANEEAMQGAYVTPAMMREVYFNVMRHRFMCEFEPNGDTLYRQRILVDAFCTEGVAGVAIPI